jgi:ABC transport system ATP-binding/permease protein
MPARLHYVRMWTLQSVDPERSLVFRLLPGSLKTMGRATGAEFIVDAPLVSRLHCRFSLDIGDRLDVEDLGSTNGTWVNGRKVERAPLQDGDTVKVGRVEFVIRSEMREGA